MSLHLNVGLLGHVDSGKTSLSKKLSEISSTAAFDKNPQSAARGITLDLGFSALTVNSPEAGKEYLFCFVDCPGHQSLIRTIIGGNLIIDMMLLVIDINKGFETQTGECLILGEIAKKPLIVVLNKIDMIEESKRENVIEKMRRKVSKTLESTIFKSSKIIPVSALKSINIENLISALVEETKSLQLNRVIAAPFIFAFDHCFTIKGSGTVLSGTVLQGSIKINDNIEIPSLKLERKVKSMQMFRKPVERAEAGDRIGLCITNFDSKLLERGLVCLKGAIQIAYSTIITLNRIKYYKREIKSKSKFHFSIGHETVMGSLTIFSSEHESKFNFNSEYLYEESIGENSSTTRHYFALIEFEHPVFVCDGMLLISSKLDCEQTNVCRLAFYGTISLENSQIDKDGTSFHEKLKIYKEKSREGNVQRLVNDHEVIADNLFKKETDRSKFERMKCQLSTGEMGFIAGSFGQSSKVRIQFLSPLESSTIDKIREKKSDVKVSLAFKKFIFDRNHRMMQ